jgi:hypothetical protein
METGKPKMENQGRGPVIPAKAGIHFVGSAFRGFAEWIPAFAGMTGLPISRFDFPVSSF